MSSCNCGEAIDKLRGELTQMLADIQASITTKLNEQLIELRNTSVLHHEKLEDHSYLHINQARPNAGILANRTEINSRKSI